MTTIIKQFEVGKSYSMRSACDHDCIWTYKVVKRTACTVILKDEYGKKMTCRINRKLTEFSKAECVLPLGSFSMNPILRAN